MESSRDEIRTEAAAALADAIMVIARQLSLRGPDFAEVLPLTGTEIIVVREVIRSAHIRPAQLAAASGLTRSNVSVAIKGLEARGLLERHRRDDNERVVELTLTPLALENFDRVKGAWAARLQLADPATLDGALEALPHLVALADDMTTRRGVAPFKSIH